MFFENVIIFRYLNYDDESDLPSLELRGAPEPHHDQFDLFALPTRWLATKRRLACCEVEQEARKSAIADASFCQILRRMRASLIRPIAKQNPSSMSASDELHIWFMDHARQQ